MPHSAPVRARNLGSIITVISTVTATAAALSAVVAPAPANATATATTAATATSCDTAAAGFTPVLQIDLPERANYLNTTPPYRLDRTAEVGSNFDRVGYCVELDGPDGPQWVWTAMEPFSTDARRIGLPTRPGELVRQRVGDLEVQSNVPSVTSGTGQTGYLEMWPNQYQESASTQVANASPITFDVDDNPTSPLGYGSFQVSQIGATRPSNIAAKQVFAINTFTESDNSLLSLGIGTNLGGQPDWTFANNANRYSQRKLTAFVRTALVALTESPQDRQLVPRDSKGGAVVPVAGRITDPGVKRVQLRVIGNGRTETFSSSASTFRFTPRITAGLHEYTFELRAIGTGIDRVAARREGVVSGDVYVVQGQSNAEAYKFNGAANVEESPYLRSFGTSTSDGTISGADRVWHYATGDVTSQSGSIGQWAVRMGRRIVDTYKIPVALFNGAHHDGCHYAYLGGYRDMGDHTYAVLARDLYAGPTAGVAPPNPSAVTATGSQLTVQLRSTDPLTVDGGVAADFRVEGAAVTVSSVAYQPGGKLVLTLSGPATGATDLIYQGHNGAGPWITNATGTGLLSFSLPLT